MNAQLRGKAQRTLVVAIVILLSTFVGPGLQGFAAAQADSTSAHAAPSFSTPRNENPGAIPSNAKSHGRSYGEWGAQWWIWATEQPFATNPLFDPTGEFCGVGQSDRVWFLAGILGGGTAERECSIPTGTPLFFPIANGLSFAPEFGETYEEIAADVANDLAGIDVSSLSVVVDGVELQDLAGYRAASGPFVLPVPERSLLTDFGLAAGDRSPAVSDGWWIMLAPLSSGEHTIEIMASGADGFELDVTYALTVEP